MHKFILFFLVMLLPATSVAENFSLKNNGYVYEIMADDSLRIYNGENEKIYSDIRFTKDNFPKQLFLLRYIDDRLAIAHCGNVNTMGVKTYYTLETTSDGITTIDCIFRRGAIAPRADAIFLPYSICSFNKKLVKENLQYYFPEIYYASGLPNSYPTRYKVQELKNVSMYYYWKSYQDVISVVQYKNKQLFLESYELYILGQFSKDKEGLCKFIRKNDKKYTVEFIDIEQLKQKILRDGVPFDINNPHIVTLKDLPMEFRSTVE